MGGDCPRSTVIRPGRYGDAIPTAALLSFRLGGSDGVAVEATKWQWALTELGFSVVTVAGEGPVDRLLPGPGHRRRRTTDAGELAAALDDADLVVVENLCSLPLNPAAAGVVADVLAGRPAVLHHHDLPWQRPRFADHPPPPTDPRWRQVTINELSRGQLADRGIAATTIYNGFALDPSARSDRSEPAAGATTEAAADRRALRCAVGVGDDDRLVLQPTRAIPRKNVAGGITMATELDAVYWLLGPAEDGFGPELDVLVAGAGCPVILGTPEGRDLPPSRRRLPPPATWSSCLPPGRVSALRPSSRSSTGAHWPSAPTRWRPSSPPSGSSGSPWPRPTGSDLARRTRSGPAGPQPAGGLDPTSPSADLPDRIASVLPELLSAVPSVGGRRGRDPAHEYHDRS